MNKKLKRILLKPFDFLYLINPEYELKLMWFLKNKQKLNLYNPVTYNEKLNWLKIFYRNDLMVQCADKLQVRNYVINKGLSIILNEVLWEGVDPSQIPYDYLPTKFVIKISNGSSNNIICTNKSELDTQKINKTVKKWLKQKYLLCYGEWVYNKIDSKIIIENYLENDLNQLIDYKVFCFDGKAQLIEVDFDRFKNHKRNLYTTDWQLVDETIAFCNDKSRFLTKPKQLDKLIEYAQILSDEFLHARVDFYIVKDNIYFGEITFFHEAGYGKFSSVEFERQLGDYLILPRLNK
jgi:hypothetical protein